MSFLFLVFSIAWSILDTEEQIIQQETHFKVLRHPARSAQKQLYLCYLKLEKKVKSINLQLNLPTVYQIEVGTGNILLVCQGNANWNSMEMYSAQLCLLGYFCLVLYELYQIAYLFVCFFLQSRFVGYLEQVFTKLNGRLPAAVSYRIKNIKIDGISGQS